MKKVVVLLMIGIGLLLTGFISHNSVQLNAPSAYDLIAAVNELRASQGLAALEIDGSLMAAAKVQSDYLASIGGPNITNGHEGAGGTRAIDRARAAGYPVVPGVDVLECWAWANSSISLSTIIYSPDIWGDKEHMDVMLHKYGKHVGAGVTQVGNNVYYILNVSTIWGVSPGGTPSAGKTPSPKTTPQVKPVIVSTPKPDGAIYHVVELGQALWSIARAYGVTVDQLRHLNNLSERAPIYAGETLIIRLAFTPMPTPTVTPTPRPPTRTPVPPQTVETLPPNPPGGAATPILGGIDRTTLGLILILICGIGLVLIIMGTLRRKN